MGTTVSEWFFCSFFRMEGYSTLNSGPTHCSETWANIVKNLWYHTKTTKFKIIVIIISFMQGIYTHIPEINYVPREYSVAAVLLLL